MSSNRDQQKKKVALVTGASSGIGEATALRLAALGIITYAAARRTERMERLKKHGIRIIKLDVTEEKSIQVCFDTIQKESGGIDILINNAGYGSYGSVEEMPMEEAKRQFEVNIFGLAAITKLVIPHMRKQRWGRIVNISSVFGVFAQPYGAWYNASKFALEGLSSSLRQELSPFDVDVIIIRPGAIKTEWSGIAAETLRNVSGHGPYAKAALSLHALFTSKKREEMAADPKVIADAVALAVNSDGPRSVYTAPFAGRMMVRILTLLRYNRLRDMLTRKIMSLPSKM